MISVLMWPDVYTVASEILSHKKVQVVESIHN